MGTSLTFPCPVSCVGVVFSNGALPFVCGKQPVVLACVWRFPWTPFDQQLRCYSVPVLETSVGDELASWGSLSCYLAISFSSLFIYFRKLQMALNFSCLFPIFLIPLSSLLPTGSFCFSSPIYPWLSILFPFLADIYWFPLVLYFIPDWLSLI